MGQDETSNSKFDTIIERMNDHGKRMNITDRKIDGLGEKIDILDESTSSRITMLAKKVDEVEKNNSSRHAVLVERIDDLGKSAFSRFAALAKTMISIRDNTSELGASFLKPKG